MADEQTVFSLTLGQWVLVLTIMAVVMFAAALSAARKGPPPRA